MRSTNRLLLVITLFALAMAFLEAAIVVYLRNLYYPDGFQFPLIQIPESILYIETGREIATIVMLWAIAYIAASDFNSTFAYFCFTFGVWDIGYYLWLKILIDWPATILDWDVLFLIPLPWIGPVLVPILVSIALIFAALCILRYGNLHLTRLDWILEITAGLIIIFSFIYQFFQMNEIGEPYNYSWWMFAAGMLLGLLVFIRRLRRAIQREN